MLFGYCGAAGVSDPAFVLEDDAAFEEDEVAEESVFDVDDVLVESVFDEDDVVVESTLDEDDELVETLFDKDDVPVEFVFDESNVFGVELSSSVEIVEVSPFAAAAGIVLYNGESTITAARRNASSFTLVFFMSFSFYLEKILLHNKTPCFPKKQSV